MVDTVSDVEDNIESDENGWSLLAWSGSESMACFGGYTVNVGDLMGSAKNAVFSDKCKSEEEKMAHKESDWP